MIRFRVSNMACGGCAAGVTRAIRSAVPDARVEIDLDARLVTVSGADPSTVAAALGRAGWEAEPA